MMESEQKNTLSIAYSTYKENYLKWGVLELLVTSKPLSNQEILSGVIGVTQTNEELHWEAKVKDIDRAIRYLSAIDLIDIVEGEEKVTATEKGVEVLRNGTYQNLANSSLFGYKGLIASYQGLDISEKAYKVSKKAYWIAISAWLLALATLAVTVLK